jgi:hypothetical protein
MSRLLLALVASTALLGDTAKGGAAWLEKVESHLYRWSKPGTLVRFQVKTNLLESAIASMEKDPDVGSDPEKLKFVEALKRVTISSTVDTETGNVTTDVDFRCEVSDPRGKAAVEKMKATIAKMVAGGFEGLPLHNPSMLAKGYSVVGSEEQGDSVVVTVAGKHEGEKNMIHVNRRNLLPETIVMPEFATRYRYVEVVPGMFAPAHLDVRLTSGAESHCDYTYQKAGELTFPSTIRVSQGPQTATFSFVSLKVEPRSR